MPETVSIYGTVKPLAFHSILLGLSNAALLASEDASFSFSSRKRSISSHKSRTWFARSLDAWAAASRSSDKADRSIFTSSDARRYACSKVSGTTSSSETPFLRRVAYSVWRSMWSLRYRYRVALLTPASLAKFNPVIFPFVRAGLADASLSRASVIACFVLSFILLSVSIDYRSQFCCFIYECDTMNFRYLGERCKVFRLLRLCFPFCYVAFSNT